VRPVALIRNAFSRTKLPRGTLRANDGGGKQLSVEVKPLICDLCNEQRTHLVRVDKWSVCNQCSADGPLQAALEAYDNLVRLRMIVKSTTAGDVEAEALQRLAQHRIGAAQKELDIAISALIPVVAKSAEAKLKALQALNELIGFEEQHSYLIDGSKLEP